jgi:multidrug resistance efflux pump
MKLNQLINFEMDKNKKSSLQVKAIKALAAFLVLMFLLTILSRAADSLTIAKVTVTDANSMTISHSIEVDGSVAANKDMAISTSANIKIASVEATEGKSVKQGDLLIQLDLDDLKKQLLQAQNELAVLQATASDKAANDAIAEQSKQESLNRIYEDYNDTIAEANDSVKKAKNEMDTALNAYNAYKKNGNQQTTTDSTVSDSLTKTIEEKQLAYDQAVNNLDGIQKDIEADVQKAIKEASVDDNGNAISLTQAEKQKIRNEIKALPENVALIENANQAIEDAQEALSEAEAALAAYEEEQSANNKASSDEQLQALYDDYVAKKEAYNEALKQKDDTVKNANRTIEDATAPESVDTVSALTEGNDLELKQLEVDKLQKLMDAEGKIVAPADGLVTKVLVSTGETTTEDTAIRIADQSSGYKFTASLDKASAKYLSKGDKVVLDIGSGTTVEGLTIDDIEVSSDDKNTYIITVSIPAKVKNLGSMATMSIDKASKKYDTCLPLNALHSDGDKYYVYTISEK